jgi:IS605 OrfB family transposase
MSLVTRCVVSKNLTKAKYTRLTEMARLCGAVRAEAWRRYRQKIRAKIFAAAHAIFDKAHSIVVEDLTHVIRGYDRGRTMNRRLASWIKGLIQQAIESVSRRRGASVNLVNAAYTSQWLPNCSAFGKRIGEFIYCPLGKGVFVVDHIAAVNVLQRKNDTGISRYLNYREVKKILDERSRQTERPCIVFGQCAVSFGHA